MEGGAPVSAAFPFDVGGTLDDPARRLPAAP
ncbi:hypothetical protein Gocc_1413 [Gaiella occulta]|uniref:Uncharacterized protein n=1 Tax=Gaiella occulta TaxID=1002870 RepID=A0A7M2YXC5_9ACTN|nr:hypothetical protein Gocc_1413 [Gaiella occulta]